MPIYAFRCEQCGHSFDRLQKLSDPDPETCPACSAATVRRAVTAPSFRLAGGGWYETDFKKDGDRKRNLADGGNGGKDGKSESGGSSEAAKPAAQPASPSPAPAAAAAPASKSDA